MSQQTRPPRTSPTEPPARPPQRWPPPHRGISKNRLTQYLRAFQLGREIYHEPGREVLGHVVKASIGGTKQTDTIPHAEDSGSAGATYALIQLAHLPEVDSIDFDELLWASTVRASEEIHRFYNSSYNVWDEGEEPEPEEAVEDLPAKTVLFCSAVTAMTGSS